MILNDVDTAELEGIDPLHCGPIEVNGAVHLPMFPEVHDQLLGLADIEGEVVVLAPHFVLK